MNDAASNRGQWHALDIAKLEAILETGPSGLSKAEAAARLERFGPNQLPEAPPPSNLVLFFHQFRSPLIYLLLVATLVTIALQEYIDAGVIAAVLLLNAVIGFTQERQAEHSVRALARLLTPHARVVRDGQEWDIESRELVPGDVVLLESGLRVPADLRLAAATSLLVDESLLTGESLAVVKRPAELPSETALADRVNLAYAGTVIAAGRGWGYVVATGATTELGLIAMQVREAKEAATPLQRRMDHFARVVGGMVVFAALLAFAIGVGRGESATEMFKVAVALAVAGVPEGLPVVLTITLAVGVRRMARRRAIVRRLPAVETLGSTTVIGSDKTGTLTENRMTVQRIWAGDRSMAMDAGADHLVSLDGAEETISAADPLTMTVLAGTLANEATISRTESGEIEVHGDPTDGALLMAAMELGLSPTELRAAYPVFAEIPFEPERQYAASIRLAGDNHVTFVKGAPERVLEMCDQQLGPDGPHPLNRKQVLGIARDLAAQGLRVLGMAYEVSKRPPADTDNLPEPEGLSFLGFQGMMDPPHTGVRDAIAACRLAGIRVVMITGDHALTARTIGRDLDLAVDDAPVLTGVELAGMDDAALRQAVRDVTIFARVTPEHKLRIVKALQHNGEVVAVTGDGVNDAPALKAADIGVAMGKGGTDVAREASDIVLTDDDFVSVAAAVEEGRVTFDNIRRVTFFLVATGVAEVLAILVALALDWPLPFLPAQILWLNLVTNGLQDVALAFEPGEPDVLHRPPRPRGEGIISRLLWERTAISALVMTIGTLALFRWELDRSGTLEQAQTIALTTMIVFEVFQAGNARSERRSLFRLSPISNPFLFIATAAAVGVHALALYLPPTQYVLRVEPIDLADWGRIILVAATVLVAVELHKMIRRGQPDDSAGT